MNSLDLKNTLLSGLLGSALVLTQAGGDNVRICTTETSQCVTISAAQFDSIEVALADKIKENAPLSWDEYNLAIAALDHEIKPGERIDGVVGNEKIKQFIIDQLYGN